MMLALAEEEIEAFGQTTKVERTEAVTQRFSVDALRQRLSRTENRRDVSFFVIEEEGAREPFFLDGVQKGWTAQPSKYRLCRVEAPLGRCFELVLVLGFRPDSCPLAIDELRDSLLKLLNSLSTRDSLKLTSVASSFMILEVESGRLLPASDAKLVMDFNINKMGAKPHEVSHSAHVRNFVERGFVLVGTAL